MSQLTIFTLYTKKLYWAGWLFNAILVFSAFNLTQMTNAKNEDDEKEQIKTKPQLQWVAQDTSQPKVRHSTIVSQTRFIDDGVIENILTKDLITSRLKVVNESSISITVKNLPNRRVIAEIKEGKTTSTIDISALNIGNKKQFEITQEKMVIVRRLENSTQFNIDDQIILVPNPQAKLSTRIFKQTPVHHAVTSNIYISGHQLNAEQKKIILQAFKQIGIKQTITFSDLPVSLLRSELIELKTEQKD